MKKLLAIPLEDEELIELCRILMDRDPDGALEFLQTHVKGKARDLLEGG
jgi:pyruvate-formate lyase-activating enzyme